MGTLSKMIAPRMARPGSRTLLLTCFAFSSMLTFLPHAGSTTRQDRSWKRYYNQQWGYCVSYPARWRVGDAFEGAGIFVETGVKKRSNPLGEIDMTALPDHAGNPQPSPSSTTVQAHLDGLKKFERAQQMELLDQRPMHLFGSSALFAKERYYDPLERAKWVDELIFAQRQNVLYRLELECRADQLTRFEPVFAQLVSTFRFNCTRAR